MNNRSTIVSGRQRRANIFDSIRLVLTILGVLLVSYFAVVGVLSRAIAWGWAA